jgi:uncharacterized protein (DUF2236 family)
MIKKMIADQIRSFAGSGRPPTDFLIPANDPGLFGPESMAWEIHRDFVSMMIGGISALILQAQHPAALAGVWDHSTFRKDLRGRLKRTAYFIAATTYGGKEMAMTSIHRVKSIHDHLHGVLPDGRTYRVSDPHLLYWVHLTEITSFLKSYETYRGRRLSRALKDQYIAEMSLIVRGLGCDLKDEKGHDRIAMTYSQALDDIRAYRSELEYTERTQTVINLIENAPTEPQLYAMNKLIIKAGFNNLPDWIYPLINRQVPTESERYLVEAAIKAMAVPVRWALSDGVHAHALRRMRSSAVRED